MKKITIICTVLALSSIAVFAGKQGKESETTTRNQCYLDLPIINRCAGILSERLTSTDGDSQTSTTLCGMIANDPKRQCGRAIIISNNDPE